MRRSSPSPPGGALPQCPSALDDVRHGFMRRFQGRLISALGDNENTSWCAPFIALGRCATSGLGPTLKKRVFLRTHNILAWFSPQASDRIASRQGGQKGQIHFVPPVEPVHAFTDGPVSTTGSGHASSNLDDWLL